MLSRLCTLQVLFAPCKFSLHLASSLCTLQVLFAPCKFSLYLACSLCTLQVLFAPCKFSLHLASSLCYLMSRIHWKVAGVNPLTPSALPLWCRYTNLVGFISGLQLVTCHGSGRSADNFEQSMYSRGCVCVVDVFFCIVRIEWTKLSKHINPIHKTSDDRYAVTVFVVRFDFWFHDLLVIDWRVTLNSWRIKDQLDVTCNFISLLMCSTCFGH